MIKTWTQILLSAVAFILLQVLVVNYIHLFGLVSPFIYIYIILKLPLDLSPSRVIFASFLVGLAVDMFSNTFGMHAAACSLMGLARLPVAKLSIDMREMPDRPIPSYKMLGVVVFLRYAAPLVAIHHAALFAVDAFNLFQPVMLLQRFTFSFIASFLLLTAIEAFNLNQVKNSER
ncbi:MAG: rod shape-determining protein MreD [Tannerella sp.]|jgi:rod shape-determining protein MreD|nr:rod shape-determining protein MreD [Tannerella sp.]